MTFVPSLFISIGETGAMFTLRETYEHVVHVGGRAHSEVRSMHHFNLGQDIDEVIEKALMISLKWGIMCKEPSKETLEAEMRDITRMKKEEREERARIIAERDAEYKRVQRQQYDSRLEKVAAGIMPVGGHAGSLISDLKTSYLKWIVENVEEFGVDNIMTAVANYIIGNAELNARVNFKFTPGFVGKIKEKFEGKVVVIKATSFMRESFGGGYMERVYVTSMADENGRCVIVLSTSFKKDEGEEFLLKAKVKDHKVYNDVDQTVLFYAKAY